MIEYNTTVIKVLPKSLNLISIIQFVNSVNTWRLRVSNSVRYKSGGSTNKLYSRNVGSKRKNPAKKLNYDCIQIETGLKWSHYFINSSHIWFKILVSIKYIIE